MELQRQQKEGDHYMIKDYYNLAEMDDPFRAFSPLDHPKNRGTRFKAHDGTGGSDDHGSLALLFFRLDSSELLVQVGIG